MTTGVLNDSATASGGVPRPITVPNDRSREDKIFRVVRTAGFIAFLILFLIGFFLLFGVSRPLGTWDSGTSRPRAFRQSTSPTTSGRWRRCSARWSSPSSPSSWVSLSPSARHCSSPSTPRFGATGLYRDRRPRGGGPEHHLRPLGTAPVPTPDHGNDLVDGAPLLVHPHLSGLHPAVRRIVLHCRTRRRPDDRAHRCVHLPRGLQPGPPGRARRRLHWVRPSRR